MQEQAIVEWLDSKKTHILIALGVMNVGFNPKSVRRKMPCSQVSAFMFSRTYI